MAPRKHKVFPLNQNSTLRSFPNPLHSLQKRHQNSRASNLHHTMMDKIKEMLKIKWINKITSRKCQKLKWLNLSCWKKVVNFFHQESKTENCVYLYR